MPLVVPEYSYTHRTQNKIRKQSVISSDPISPYIPMNYELVASTPPPNKTKSDYSIITQASVLGASRVDLVSVEGFQGYMGQNND